MGFLLPAINQEKLDNQRDVVKNERRQSYENSSVRSFVRDLSRKRSIRPRTTPTSGR